MGLYKRFQIQNRPLQLKESLQAQHIGGRLLRPDDPRFDQRLLMITTRLRLPNKRNQLPGKEETSARKDSKTRNALQSSSKRRLPTTTDNLCHLQQGVLRNTSEKFPHSNEELHGLTKKSSMPETNYEMLENNSKKSERKSQQVLRFSSRYAALSQNKLSSTVLRPLM